MIQLMNRLKCYTSNTTCKMLEKANNQGLEGLSAYTMRNLDSEFATGSDISQYKITNVKKHLLTLGKSILIRYAFPLYFQLSNMESTIRDKAIQHKL
uniref:Uncharacterized protein n=1 Tax=Amphimedon queenslandica TaxID=400682 RepID=A0A1X7TUF5_AMPQE